MNMELGRTVVTGHRDGTAVIESDRTVDAVPLAGNDVTARFLLERADCQVAYLTIAPGANEAYHGFIVSALGDMADRSSPGFHTTPTVDVVFVVAGRLQLELDAETTTLGPGDVVVQNETRHRWSNVGDTDAVLASVVLPARRSS